MTDLPGTPPPASASRRASLSLADVCAEVRRVARARMIRVRMYLREIGQVPLLTGPEEVALAQRIEAGTAVAERLADLSAPGQLDELEFEERRRLQRLASDGEAAKRELTRANLRLVVSIAKRYVGRGNAAPTSSRREPRPHARAVEKFDWTKGFKFSTYATWWIRQAITRAIADQARTIRIPVHMVESINRVHRVQRQMLQELERSPAWTSWPIGSTCPSSGCGRSCASVRTRCRSTHRWGGGRFDPRRFHRGQHRRGASRSPPGTSWGMPSSKCSTT